MEKTNRTDLRGIANDFVMPGGEILNSKKTPKNQFAQTWLSLLGERLEQGIRKGVRAGEPLGAGTEKAATTPGCCCSAQASACKELEVSRWQSKFVQGWISIPPMPANPCLVVLVSELLGSLAQPWGHPSALQRVHSNSTGELHLSIDAVQLRAAAFQEWGLCRRATQKQQPETIQDQAFKTWEKP